MNEENHFDIMTLDDLILRLAELRKASSMRGRQLVYISDHTARGPLRPNIKVQQESDSITINGSDIFI